MAAESVVDYASEVCRMMERQLRDWETVKRNYAALAGVLTRTLNVGRSKIVLQYNPERIRSSAAEVSKEALAARKCFLCTENQPKEQETLDWHGMYKIQVNPYPIFPRHLTIACWSHTPQSVAGRMGHMVRLAADLSDFVILYNGPKCGASAPDHMHFQAGNKGFLPICDELADAEREVLLKQGSGTLSLVEGLGRRCFVVEASDADCAEALFDRLEMALPLHDGDTEPMQNLLCWHDGGEWRIVVFPRVKHRPSCYGTGKGQFLLSPASVDMGGVFAVPVEADFSALTADAVQAMLDELCIGADGVEQVIDRLMANK